MGPGPGQSALYPRPAGREYRDGGGLHGAQMSLDSAKRRGAAGAGRPAGPLHRQRHRRRRRPAAGTARAGGRGGRLQLRYRELDPDVFGEELERPEYADVERIAVVAATVVRSPAGTRKLASCRRRRGPPRPTGRRRRRVHRGCSRCRNTRGSPSPVGGHTQKSPTPAR